uniref:Metalloendopeptidase n=1 Tax=Tetraodon nigroviridis TaxID=99883 RepID=H3C1S1_TETNG
SAAAIMSPLVCLVFALSLATAPMAVSGKSAEEPEQPEEPSVSKVIENVNKNITLLEHGDIRRPLRRNAAPCTATGCKWPKSRYYVYVPISISSAYTTTQRNIIINALLSFHDSTCIRFHWRGSENSYLNFISDYGYCWSYVGRQGGRQDVSLQARGCLYHEVVQHEVLHALGFHHEQVRSDRDNYIRILTENIIPGMEHNFQIEKTNNLGTPYDFNSVMQYENTAFSKNGQNTIVSKSDPGMIFGTARKMSQNSILAIKQQHCKKQRL